MVTITEATALALQGCFIDVDTDPALSDVIEKSENVTVESCVSQCRERGYLYAGVQYELVSLILPLILLLFTMHIGIY